MNKEEMKNKYSAFITEISEILGLGKPVDILKLCATTDLFFQPLEKRIAELEKKVGMYQTGMFDEIEKRDKKLTEALKHLKDLTYVVELGKNELATARILAEAKQFLSEVEK